MLYYFRISNQNFSPIYLKQRLKELFTIYKSINDITHSFDERKFLKNVYNLGSVLDREFFNPKRETSILQPESRIYMGLLNKSKLVRNTFAESLMIAVFSHPDKSFKVFMATQGETELALMDSYGQMARFINHIDDSLHIFNSDNDIPSVENDKSYWVLKPKKNILDLYKYLRNGIMFGGQSYDIKNVEITNRYGLQNIIVDIGMPKYMNDIIFSAKAFDASHNLVDADGIRFIVRESNGYFAIVTAYPIYRCFTRTDKRNYEIGIS